MKKLTKSLSLIALLCVSCACALFTACEVHHHTKGEYLYTLPATCTAFGYDYYTCSTCSDGRYSEIIPKAGHDFTNYFSDENATCEQNGTETAVCNREECSATKTREIANSALGHSFGEYVYNNNATCTQNGTKTAACQREGCKIIRNEVVEGSMLEHELSDWIIVEESTCTSNGSRCKKCLTCEVVFETETIPLLSHFYEDTVIPSTCITQGYTFHECKICGYSCIDTYLELSEHTKITIDAVAPTCTLTGLTEGKKCSTCDEIFVVQEVISANGHNYEDSNQCCVCEYISTDCFEFTLLSDETYEIKVKDVKNLPAEISLPNVYNGKLVTVIADSAFFGAQNMLSIVIPDSFTLIKDHAFSSCSSLISIEFSDNISYIGSTAFYYCASLTSVNLPNSLITIASFAFYECFSLASVEMGNGITTIEERAFDCCINLTSIEIPNSVTYIGDSAFDCCSSLTSIEIPNSVTYIGENVFVNCGRLTNIEVSEDNENYKDIDGNLYSKDETILIQYATGKTAYLFKVPNSVTRIGSMAFKNCSSLTLIEIPNSVTYIGELAFADCSLSSVVIPDSVTSIGFSAFSGCSSLTSIVIPNSVASIGKDVFYDCDNLTNIKYCGSYSEWVAISKNYWNNGMNANYTITYNYVEE